MLFEKNDRYSKPKYITGAFLHDIGKLMTQSLDEYGVAHYYNHGEVGSYYILSHIALDKELLTDILDICFLINYHMMPFSWTSDKAKQKWKKCFGEYKYRLLLYFNECDKAR